MGAALHAAASGDVGAAFDIARPHLLAQMEQSGRDEGFTVTWTATADWAIEAGRFDELPALLALVQDAPVDEVTPVLTAQLLRLRGTATAAEAARAVEAEADLKAAVDALDSLGAVPYLARAQAALGGLLQAQGRADEAAPLVAAARASFERLRARHWLARLA
jgi:hypothetical protein